MFRRCPFCHRWVLSWFYSSHEKKHTRLREDGQMTDHITAPAQERYSGSLDGVPQSYLHPLCGVVTQMPEEIIRTYLANPMTYTDGSFCCGCEDYIDSSQLVWDETDEVVMDYMGRLRLNYCREVLGMCLSDRPTGITITARAAQQMEALIRKIGAEVVLTIIFPTPEQTGFRIGFRHPNEDGSTRRFTSHGIDIELDKEDAKQANGIVIDFPRVSESFLVARFYAP